MGAFGLFLLTLNWGHIFHNMQNDAQCSRVLVSHTRGKGELSSCFPFSTFGSCLEFSLLFIIQVVGNGNLHKSLIGVWTYFGAERLGIGTC